MKKKKMSFEFIACSKIALTLYFLHNCNVMYDFNYSIVVFSNESLLTQYVMMKMSRRGMTENCETILLRNGV